MEEVHDSVKKIEFISTGEEVTTGLKSLSVVLLIYSPTRVCI